MRKWSIRKVLIHAALDSRNPFGWLVSDEFSYRCLCGQSLYLDALAQSVEKK